MSQRPSDRSDAAMAAWPSKKLSVRRSITRRAVCSLPIAKVARLVLGVSVEVIKGPGNRCRRKIRCPLPHPLPGNRVAQQPCLRCASTLPQANGRPASPRTTFSTLSHAKNLVRKMRCRRVFTACELEMQGLFTALHAETYPGFSHACCHVIHGAALLAF